MYLITYSVLGLYSLYRDIIDKFEVDSDDLGLDEMLLIFLKGLHFKDYVFNPLNNLFGSDNATYAEDVFVETTVDAFLFSVSRFTFIMFNSCWPGTCSLCQMSLHCHNFLATFGQKNMQMLITWTFSDQSLQ